MQLQLHRLPSSADTTLGVLLIDGVYECVTLEDQVRDTKVMAETAIPAGRYKLTISWSPKFQRDMVLVNDVPGFTGIRIHSGNDKEDTSGCVLVGRVIESLTRISGGSVELPILQAKISKAAAYGEEVWLEIKEAS